MLKSVLRSRTICTCYHLEKLGRQYATKNKAIVITEQNVLDNINQESYKPRNHPGVFKPRIVKLPDLLVGAIENVTKDYPVRSLVTEGIALNRHLQAKMPPVEKSEMRRVNQEVKNKVESKLGNFKINCEADETRYKYKVASKTYAILKREIYNWQPLNVDAYNSLVYLVGRIAPEFAVMSKIFAEIAARDPGFYPRTLFDFGSGVGSVTWAANQYWKRSLFEYLNVDSSSHMNDLAQILLQGGRPTNVSPKGVFYRQFLSATSTAFDLVVSAYTLLEMPSRQARLETVLNLWNKTHKYLVLVEHGTNAGFKLIDEVRDFLRHSHNENSVGHVFSPCPHDDICPRYLKDDGTPCNFSILYETLPLGVTSERKQERYCYVVFKKGERDSLDPQWPRAVRETLVRSKHSICRFCTKEAKLQEVIFTASKHGKTTYHCARNTKWGDLLPVDIKANDLNDSCDSHDGNQEKTEEETTC